ncbi:hypothetical protein E2562_034450 [Oryza meyeriana var. granulata]|uniref:Uncharacterized protein n=1 Tax=Oryza meyeriana var. granulata TaxID=110450 RepID=A0A6G1CW29_9ORYZ|nr:hypothetical protein E2562_034450 [Oryza meyeriana var. granulata]
MGRQPCCDKVGLKKGPWTAEEDQKLVGFLLTHGHCCWRIVPKLAGLLRCGKSCRLRWTNYLRPDLKRGLLSDDEERLVIELHAQLGNRWSKIAARLPGRTDNEIKNHWNTHIKKKLRKMGIDPVTHQPLDPPRPPVGEQDVALQAPAPPEQQGTPPHQELQGGDVLREAEENEEEEVPLIEPHEITSPPPAAAAEATSNCSVSPASVLSPSCSSSASAASAVSGVDVAEWPEPMYLFGMDGIMDVGWDGLVSGAGVDVDPFDHYYHDAGFDDQDVWII